MEVRIEDSYTNEEESVSVGNKLLYKLCEDNPMNDDVNGLIAKLWLIGRSYAAAIERRRNASEENDDFYYEVVAPLMLDIGPDLDARLEMLRKSSGTIKDDVEAVLSTHRFLTDAFYDITELEKRSLVSKYLHFHCPNKFFIYDSRAKETVGKLIKKANRSFVSSEDNDSEYRDFVCRMIELQDLLTEVTNERPSPRQLDNFLLFFFSQLA